MGFAIVQSLSRVRLLATPWTAARQASLSFTSTQSLIKLISIESGMPSNHLILLSSPSPPTFRVFCGGAEGEPNQSSGFCFPTKQQIWDPSAITEMED